jgi:hypothetical protein
MLKPKIVRTSFTLARYFYIKKGPYLEQVLKLSKLDSVLELKLLSSTVTVD